MIIPEDVQERMKAAFHGKPVRSARERFYESRISSLRERTYKVGRDSRCWMTPQTPFEEILQGHLRSLLDTAERACEEPPE